MVKIKVDILPNYFLKNDGIFDKNEALKLSGKIAGVCYDSEGFLHLTSEMEEKTMSRVGLTLNNGHHSVYDHITMSLNLQNVPKILAMVLNNEHQYTTSEKSARYTSVERNIDSIITEKEEKLYNKWLNIFKIKIKSQYGHIYSDFKIKTLSQENARYLITVFMPTQMIYSTTLRQINYIASWFEKYIIEIENKKASNFEIKLANAMKDFVFELERINVLIPELMNNEKHRSISLFGNNLMIQNDYYGNIYSCVYNGTFAQFAQIQRHRTIDYKMELLEKKKYFIPPILLDDENLKKEWIKDIHSVEDINPQGELVRINERGKYEDFILKCKERLCSCAQLETMLQTKEILLKYKKSLELANNPLLEDIKKYSNGARCTFPDFICTSDCKFKEGKTLNRKI